MASKKDAKNGKKYYGMSLLLADDEEQILNVLKTIGDMLGFKVITAKDGQEALKVF